MEQWKELIRYNALTGEFTSKSSKRIISPDAKGLLTVTYRGERFKIPAAKAAVYITTGKTPGNNEVILHRNLDREDIRYCNLEIIPRKVYSEIMCAYRNLNANLKILPHPTDVFSYTVQWQDGSTRKKKLFSDIVVARRFFMKKQLEFAKILNKYTRFD